VAVVADLTERAAWRNFHALTGARIFETTTPAPPSGTGETVVLAYDMRDGEKRASDAANAERCETSIDNNAGAAPDYRFRFDTEYHMDLRVRFAPSYVLQSDWQIFSQTHLEGGGTQPILIFNTSPSGGGVIQFKTSQGGGHTVRFSTPFTSDEWHWFQLRFVLSKSASNGLVALRYQGVDRQLAIGGGNTALVCPVATIPASTAADAFPYLKQGMYRSAGVSGNTLVYHHATKTYDADPGSPAPGGPVGPSITAAPDAVRFGNITGTAWSGMGANGVRGSDFDLSERADVSRLVAWIDGFGSAGAGSQVLRGCIYAAATGALLATSPEVTIDAGDAEGWVPFVFSSPVRLDPSAYRLAVLSGATSQVARYAHASISDALRWGTDAYADGPLTTWAATGLDAKRMAIYAAYTAVAAPPPPVAGGSRSVSGSRACSGSRGISGSRAVG